MAFTANYITRNRIVNLRDLSEAFVNSFNWVIDKVNESCKPKPEENASISLTYIDLSKIIEKGIQEGTMTEKDAKKRMNCFRDKVGYQKTVTLEYFETVYKTYSQI